MRCMPRGAEALHGQARLSCHRWITAASVMASTAHPRTHRSTLLSRPLDAHVVAGWMALKRDSRWPRRVMRCMPRGVEALHGGGRRSHNR